MVPTTDRPGRYTLAVILAATLRWATGLALTMAYFAASLLCVHPHSFSR